MSAIVFDVRGAERRLKAAGASEELAEATVDLMSEAVLFNLDALVTKDYLDARLDARFSEMDARLNARFSEMDARLDARFSEMDARLDARFSETDARSTERFSEFDLKFNDIDARFDKLSAELTGDFRLLHALLALLLAGVFLPQLRIWLGG